MVQLVKDDWRATVPLEAYEQYHLTSEGRPIAGTSTIDHWHAEDYFAYSDEFETTYLRFWHAIFGKPHSSRDDCNVRMKLGINRQAGCQPQNDELNVRNRNSTPSGCDAAKAKAAKGCGESPKKVKEVLVAIAYLKTYPVIDGKGCVTFRIPSAFCSSLVSANVIELTKGVENPEISYSFTRN